MATIVTLNSIFNMIKSYTKTKIQNGHLVVTLNNIFNMIKSYTKTKIHNGHYYDLK